MPPCLSLRDWHQGGKSTPPVPCAVHLSSRPRFLHFTLNHHTSREGRLRGSSRMRGNFHVRFLGGWGAAMLPGYPARLEKYP